MLNKIKEETNNKMQVTYDTFKDDLKGLRAGRASTSILDGVIVNIYNNNMRLHQIATVSTAGNKMLTVTVWDVNNAEEVKKAIVNSNLGLNPILEGATIKIPLPELSMERRKELVKVANGYAERSKIAIRNVRRDGIASLKNLNKNKEISEDELHRAMNDIQKSTDNMESEIDNLLNAKTKEILSN